MANEAPKTAESTKQTFPPGHQSPGTPPGAVEYETKEPKRREVDPATGEAPERMPEHEPGFEAKHAKDKKPAEGAKGAEHDDEPHKRATGPARAASAKQHVKRMMPSKPITVHPGKVKIRKHK